MRNKNQEKAPQDEQKKDNNEYTAMGFIAGFLTIALIAVVIHFLSVAN